MTARFVNCGKRGNVLLETVMVLGLVALVIPAVLNGLSSLTTNADLAYDRSVLFELAQSQVEDVQRQAYQENAANYTLVSAPSGYSIAVSASPAVAYTYPSPGLTTTQQTVQLVTVTVTGVRGNLTLDSYKVRR